MQISAYIDTLIASLLPTGAVTGLANAQLLYTLPVSLFGMSVAAAELPAMAARARGRMAPAREALRARLECGPAPDRVLRRAVGDGVSGLRRRDRGGAAADGTLPATRMRCIVWGILAGSALGLLASTLGRLYSSTYYALHDTRTPLAFAVVRIGVGDGPGLLARGAVPRQRSAFPRSGALPA